MGVSAGRALFIGDSVSDDVVGADNAQIPVAWVNPKNEPLPPGAPTPRYMIAQLSDLISVLSVEG
jgi:FMN phosphatase YigB (HAD superfamily)